MASEDIIHVIEECFKKLNHNTSHPENFLSLQDDVATDFTSITKTLYDLHKSEEPEDFKASPLAQLVVEHFDEEQIWQELELQNSAVLKHFQSAVEDALSDETLGILESEGEVEEEVDENNDEEEDNEDEQPDDEEEEEEEEEGPAGEEDEDITDEDSDLDFDVDALEKREKQKKSQQITLGKNSKLKVVPSEVDDKFFKLSEMESFLDDMDKKEGKDNADGIDYFQDLPSDDDGDINLELLSKKTKKKTTADSSRNLKYKDYFDNTDGAVGGTEDPSSDQDNMDEDMEAAEDEDGDEFEAEEESDQEEDETNQSKTSTKKVTFNLSEDGSEGEDLADIFGGKKQSPEKVKSSFEKRQDKMSEKIDQLEKAALGEKSWQLKGEVTAEGRPENSMLEEHLEFEQTSRRAPAITEETTLQLEDIIKQRIKDQAFDDVVRKEKPKEEAFEYKKRLTLDHEKSKQSLAEIYEQEYLKQNQQKTEEEEKPAHVEIQKLMDTLFLKLDALSNFHFTPKPSAPEVKVVSNLPSISMEEVAPVTASDATLLAPEEIKEKNKSGDILGATEKTATDKKRERRHKKKAKKIKIKERETRQKLKDAATVGENKRPPSKAEAAESLKKLTKGGKATILKDEGKDKALRSSQAFFSQLQDQVKSQIKGAKDQSSKKKKLKEVSVSKLKL